jgi:hypothetical protein
MKYRYELPERKMDAQSIKKIKKEDQLENNNKEL